MDVQYLKKYNEFKCAQDRCIDNCCRGWSVPIDEDTYKKYISAEECRRRGLPELIEEAYVNGEKFYKFKNTGEGGCPFLENELCRLQLDMGEEYQSEICRNFPRIIRDKFGRKQYSLTLSCPAAAELMLFDTDFIDFEEYRDESEVKNNYCLKQGLKYETIYTIQTFSICVLQARSSPLFDRLAFLALFLMKAAKILSGGSGSAQEELMKSCEEHLTYFLGRAGGIFDNVRGGEMDAAQKQLLNSLLPMFKGIFSEPLRGGQNKNFFEKLGKMENSFEHITVDKLVESTERLFRPYYKTHETVFENYLVMDMFNTDFPRGYKELELAGKIFFLKYILLQIFISFVFVDEERLTDGDIVNAVYYFTKRVTHDREFYKYAEERVNSLSMNLIVNILQIYGT